MIIYSIVIQVHCLKKVSGMKKALVPSGIKDTLIATKLQLLIPFETLYKKALFMTVLRLSCFYSAGKSVQNNFFLIFNIFCNILRYCINLI